MKTLQFKTTKDFDEWRQTNDIYPFCDGYEDRPSHFILQDELDELQDMEEKYGLDILEHDDNGVFLRMSLTDEQYRLFCEAHCVDYVILEYTFGFTLRQREIVARIRKDFKDAELAGLQALISDGENALYFVNTHNILGITTADDLSGDWREIDGKYEFVKKSDDEMSHFAEIDPKAHLLSIQGTVKMDFCGWGCCTLPWFAHIKV